MTQLRQQTGRWGERAAVNFLEEAGYEILKKNFRIKKCEIDIIATKEYQGEKTLCFIEVKTRNGEVGSAERAVDRKKQAHIKHAAKEFCLTENINTDRTAIRFEQVSVYIQGDNIGEIFHYEIPQN